MNSQVSMFASSLVPYTGKQKGRLEKNKIKILKHLPFKILKAQICYKNNLGKWVSLFWFQVVAVSMPNVISTGSVHPRDNA
jgi:hypothetical protein